jgi:hypothetical protein
VNTSNRVVKVSAVARAGDRTAWLDPLNMTSMDFTEAQDLAPYQSRVLLRRTTGGVVEGFGSHSEPPPTIELPNWKVTFPSLGYTTQVSLPRSWTDDERTQFYSGQAIYETSFTIARSPGAHRDLSFGEGTPVEPDRRPNGMRALLESPVREAAQVYINGQFAGSVWHPPYELDVSKFLRIGENQIRIVVANTAINALAGQALPDYKLLNLRYTERFTPQDMKDLKPLPSGILGPVRLVSK